MSFLIALLEFLTVLVAAFKGLSVGDKWVSGFISAIRENTEQLRIFNESKNKDIDG